MAAYSNLITLTATSPFTGTFRLSAGQLIKVITSGSGAKVYYYNNTASVEPVVVSQTPAAISTASQMLVALTVTGGTIYVNANRIVTVSLDPVSGTGSVVVYFDPYGASYSSYVASETPAALQTAIAAIVGSGGGGIPVTGLTAHAGGGQGSATQLSFGYNEVTTVATAGDSVKLQPAQAGAITIVLNDGANAMDVFPATGDTINDGSVNAAISVAPGVTMTFTAIDSTNWETGSQTIETNSIKELTSGSGVTMQSTNIFQDVNDYSTATTITAFAGGGQGSATALTKEFNNITTCATAGDSVKLLPAVTGLRQIVRNSTTRAVDVFPSTGDSINSLAVNLAVSVPARCETTFDAIDATVFKTNNESITALNAVNTDNLAEKTVGSGITANNKLIFATTNNYSNATTITAFAGGGQGSATPLSKEFNNITVCATAGDSVQLLTAVAGLKQIVKNNGATSADIFPATGGTINGLSANTAIRIAVGEIIVFYGVDGTNWQTSSQILATNNIVRTPLVASVASGGTITGKQLIDGNISGTGATGTWQLPSASAITTAIGATPAGTTFDFTFNATNMTATNVATLLVGANMVALKQTSSGDSATSQLLTITQTSTNQVGLFRIVFDTATTCVISRIG